MTRWKITLTALTAVVLLSGCGLESVSIGGSSGPQPTGEAQSGLGAAKESGDIPDPCTLLTEAQVTGLTGREITQIDEDGGQPGDIARFCQWQQSGGQLAVFLSRTTAAGFTVTVAEAETVDGLGEDAYWHSGHLFVLYGTVQIDVYSRGGSDQENRADATKVAEVLLPTV